MEGFKYLGIYIAEDKATVACVTLQGQKCKIIDCFNVSIEQDEQADVETLAGLIAQKCDEKNMTFSEIGIALDCKMFMQHSVHSEFQDTKQIAQTIRFDTEDALATDISDVAVAFKINAIRQTGSGLTVFTAKKKKLADILKSLQSNRFDPVAVEPDVFCLARFLLQNAPSSQEDPSLFAMLSGRAGYFIVPDSEKPNSPEQATLRTFLIGGQQDRNQLLAREVPLTIALLGTTQSVNHAEICDSTGFAELQQLGETLRMQIKDINLTQFAEAPNLAECDCVELAIACGAAMGHLEKTKSINFRNDFMPYLGKKMKLQKALKVASICVLSFMLAAGLYLQIQLYQKSEPLKDLRKKFAKEYSAVMAGKKMPSKSKKAVSKLGGELRRIENAKSGQLGITGEISAAAKVTMVLEAFNKRAAEINLSIDSIGVTSKNINIVGNTSSRENTLALFEAIEEKMEILQRSVEYKAGVDTFRITVEPKK